MRKLPSYSIAGWSDLASNLRLLAACAAELLGLPWPVQPTQALMQVLVAGVYVAAWLWGLRRALGRRASHGELALVLLVFLTATAFVLSPNPRDFASSRYLLPWLTSLPLLAAALLVRLSRRQLAVALALTAALIVYPLWRILSYYRGVGQVDGWTPVGLHEPLLDVVAFLRNNSFEGAYADYWEAYKATFLALERPIVAPFDDWDRYPAYTRHVNSLGRVAYVLRTEQGILDPGRIERLRQSLERFRNRLASAGVDPEVVGIGPFLVFHGAGGARLLPPSMPGAARPLRRPCARLELLDSPSYAEPAQRLELGVHALNCSDAVWSATGLPLAAGSLRVAAAYRWYDLQGRSVVDNPERSLLPGDVQPGDSIWLTVRAPAPPAPGTYDLAVTLVQENVAWFDLASGSLSAKVRVDVSDRVGQPELPLTPDHPR
jgi:hypothetical protein